MRASRIAIYHQSVAASTRLGREDDGAGANRRVFRDEILAAATELFATRGYRATNLGDVAKRLGVTRQALYYHFSSKAEILLAVHLEFFDLLDAVVEEAMAAVEDPGERLRGMLRSHVRAVAEQPMYSSVFVQEHRTLPREFESVVGTRRRDYHQRFVTAYETAAEAGYVRSDVAPSVAVSLMFGAANWTYRWFRPDGRLSSSDVARIADELLMTGMLAR